tara:strand:- start:29 stop:820 length:792 start_codon:yes stop_codon:yes gene_type:complete
MKLSSLRPGMIYQNVGGGQTKITVNNLYEVIKVVEGVENGYNMSTVWLGNIHSKSALTIDYSALNNPKAWKYHPNAQIEQVLVKQITFPDRKEPIILSSSATDLPSDEKEVSPEPREKPELRKVVHALPSPKRELSENERPGEAHFTDGEFYASLANYTYDDLELLCGHLANTPRIRIDRARPSQGSVSYMVHQQEWSCFKDQQYSLRQIRDLKLRISHGSGAGQPVSYQRICERLMQGLIWFGNSTERGCFKKNKIPLLIKK